MMSKARKIMGIICACLAVGAVTGMLYAPAEGVETRRKLKRLKRKLTFGCTDDGESVESLDELRTLLEKELAKVNSKIDKLG